METLSNLFGSEGRVKIMRLFLFNPEVIFEVGEIGMRTKSRFPVVRKEARLLEKAKLIKRRKFKIKRKKVSGWTLNPDFPHLSSLQNLLLSVTSLQEANILERLTKIGRLKAVILSGVFIQDWEARADILVVADRIKRRQLENFIKYLEAEIGREIKYVALETHEYQYRLSFGDKLLRDILDYPHKVALDRFGNLS